MENKLGLLKVRWNKYIPQAPTPKQLAFISLPHEEALYGGAAGGGKTSALLMLALQYFDCPGHRGIIFRRRITDHKLPNSVLNRALTWLEPFIKTKEVHYAASEHTLYSKEGGILTFGYLDKEGSKERYQGSEFHDVFFDELTHFHEAEYLYLFSRIRRVKANKEEALYPLRMRGGSNPGGVGGSWVKKRWGIYKDEDNEFRGHSKERPFIQAKCRDNPHLDVVQYDRNLSRLDPITRNRLKDGDWSASENAIFKDYYFENRWVLQGDYYQLHSNKGVRAFHKNQLFYFTSIDTAGSEKTGIEGRVLNNTRSAAEPCSSVCGYFGMTPDFDLLWLDNYRGMTTIPEFIRRIVSIHNTYKPTLALIESNSIGQGVFQGVREKGIQVIPITSVADKIVRSTSAQLRAEAGKIWLPRYAEWLGDLEDELFVWTGLRGEVDDQIDVLSLASSYVASRALGSELNEEVARTSHIGFPTRREGLRPLGGHVESPMRGRNPFLRIQM